MYTNNNYLPLWMMFNYKIYVNYTLWIKRLNPYVLILQKYFIIWMLINESMGNLLQQYSKTDEISFYQQYFISLTGICRSVVIWWNFDIAMVVWISINPVRTDADKQRKSEGWTKESRYKTRVVEWCLMIVTNGKKQRIS